MTVDAAGTTVADVVAALAGWYPPEWAADWDRVGLVVGEPSAPVTRALLAVDCVPETVDEAVEAGADIMIVHHPLLLRGVSSVAATTYKGTIVHRLIRSGIALLVAHTNADVANPGVCDALAQRLKLTDLRPLIPDGPPGVGTGRVGELPRPMTLAELVEFAALRLPATPGGVRAAGDPEQPVRTLAVCGGAGDPFLAAAAASAADAYLTSDLRHHVASEHLAAGGPALLDAAHWATERPWLDLLAGQLADALPIATVVSDLPTDPWTLHVPAAIYKPTTAKEPRP
ncbi:Nif3-like dinuclear metal center hexameric protein [Luedemannella flava]|uniref:GTP cyclohydrolase 1 type 2 homolog n=1 Tax=Luedemannella flava TaxID=349316 RepID=A0ABP4YH24_9ACTN